MAQPQFDPQKTLSDLREARSARITEAEHALQQVHTQVPLAAASAQVFINKALAWIESQVSLEETASSYQEAKKEGLEKKFSSIMSSRLRYGFDQMRLNEMSLGSPVADGQKVSQFLLQSYLVGVALPSALEAISSDSLSKALENSSGKELFERVKSKMLDQVDAASKFLTDNASSTLVQNVASGTASGIYHATIQVRDSAHTGSQSVRVLKDHDRFVIERSDSQTPARVALRNPKDDPEDEALRAQANQFLTDVIKHENPFIHTISRNGQKIRNELEWRGSEICFQAAPRSKLSQPKSWSLARLFRKP